MTRDRGDREQPARRVGRDPARPAVVRLTGPALGDLEALNRKDPQIVRWALKKMLLLERAPEAGVALRGALVGWRKLVVGDRDWRIIWRVTHEPSGLVVDVAEVWAVGARADAEVYAEMRERVATLDANPTTVALADVIDRLGRAARGLGTRPEESAGPALPDWLVLRLTQQVGLPEEAARRLTLEEAFDAWSTWTRGGGS